MVLGVSPAPVASGRTGGVVDAAAPADVVGPAVVLSRDGAAPAVGDPPDVGGVVVAVPVDPTAPAAPPGGPDGAAGALRSAGDGSVMSSG